MPDTGPEDAQRLHDTAVELLKSANGDTAAATAKLASQITDNFELATAISADYLATISRVEVAPIK